MAKIEIKFVYLVRPTWKRVDCVHAFDIDVGTLDSNFVNMHPESMTHLHLPASQIRELFERMYAETGEQARVELGSWSVRQITGTAAEMAVVHKLMEDVYNTELGLLQKIRAEALEAMLTVPDPSET